MKMLGSFVLVISLVGCYGANTTADKDPATPGQVVGDTNTEAQKPTLGAPSTPSVEGATGVGKVVE